MGVLKFAGLVAVLFSVVNTAGADKAYIDALTFGADAAVNVLVCDEAGHPIEGANVNYAYWFRDLKHSLSVTGITDRTGHYLATGKCTADVHITVSCEGYYSTRIERYMTSFGAKPYVAEGKWQPYGAELPITLRRIVNPIPLEKHLVFKMKIPITNSWIGFDMSTESFVAPYGDGKESDFSIRFNWDGKIRKSYNGSSLDLRFPGLAGGYWHTPVVGSEFGGALSADTNANYISNFSFYEFKTNSGWKENLFPNGGELVVRTRCRLYSDGRLMEATYGQFSMLKFGWGGDGKGDLRLAYRRNPRVNDPNLEAMPKKNLWVPKRRIVR